MYFQCTWTHLKASTKAQRQQGKHSLTASAPRNRKAGQAEVHTLSCLTATHATNLPELSGPHYQSHGWTGCSVPLPPRYAFSLPKEGSTQALNHRSERKRSSETGESQLCRHTLFQTIPEQGSQEENTVVSNTSSILKPHCNPRKCQEEDKSALHLHTFLLKLVETNWACFLVCTIRTTYCLSWHVADIISDASVRHYEELFPHLKFPVQGRSLEKKTSVRSKILVRVKRIQTHTLLNLLLSEQTFFYKGILMALRKETHLSDQCCLQRKWKMVNVCNLKCF